MLFRNDAEILGFTVGPRLFKPGPLQGCVGAGCKAFLTLVPSKGSALVLISFLNLLTLFLRPGVCASAWSRQPPGTGSGFPSQSRCLRRARQSCCSYDTADVARNCPTMPRRRHSFPNRFFREV